MKTKLLPPLLFACLVLGARADDLSFQAEVTTSVQQYSGGGTSQQSYGAELDFFAFNADWGSTHTTPYVPQSITVGPLLGTTHTLTDPTSNPGFLVGSGTGFPAANGSAYGLESSGASQPFAFFGGFVQVGSYDKSDLTPFSLTLNGGNFDQTVFAFNLDVAKLPAIPLFSAAATNALQAASPGKDLTIGLPDFTVPPDALNAHRFLELYDITRGFFPPGFDGVTLDAGINSFSTPAGTFIGGDQYGLSLYDNYTRDGIIYAAGTYFVFNTPQSVPETGASGVYALMGLGSVTLLRRRVRGISR